MKTFDSSPIRLAVIDTDSGFVQVLVKRLEARGWEHRQLGAAPRVEELVAMRVNALVLDLATLGPDAWDYLERLAGDLPGLGVVVCTGRTSVAQRVRGLRMGADDWITKPCHPEEVLARVEAVVRRRKQASAGSEDETVSAGELEIRPDQFQAFVGGRSVDLTRREFELLQLLAQAKGRVLQREEIYELIWGYAMARGDRSVDVFVRKVRQKLEQKSPSWSYIHTHFGVGYRFDPEAAGGPAGAGDEPIKGPAEQEPPASEPIKGPTEQEAPASEPVHEAGADPHDPEDPEPSPGAPSAELSGARAASR